MIIQKSLLLAMAFSVLLLSSCTKDDRKSGDDPQNPPIEEPEQPDDPVVKQKYVTVYTTYGNGAKLFEESRTDLVKGEVSGENVITINPAEKHQTMVGFGPAMTGASCYNLLRMAQEDRTAILKELFSPTEGLGISLVRVSIGSSDFSVNEDFTWCDKEGIENFGIPKEDKEYLLPILHEVYEINPGLKIIASPWTCPLWMKRMSVNDDSDFIQTNPQRSAWASGSLKPSCYQDYATYFVKWIEAMTAEGFDIYAITVQNEPYNPENTASLYMTWQEQRDFVKEALGPAFRKAGIVAKILCFDHNYDGYKYPINIFNDPDAAQYISGSAWHNYGGEVTSVSEVLKEAPDKEIYFTEASIGEWNYKFLARTIMDFRDLFMAMMERDCKGITLWNLALDENNNPHRHHGCATCYGVITISSTEHKVIDRLSHYYDLAHTSKVIKPDAVRIGAGGLNNKKLSYMAFLNPDGTHSLVMVNSSLAGESISFTVDDGEHAFKGEIPAATLMSFIW